MQCHRLNCTALTRKAAAQKCLQALRDVESYTLHYVLYVTLFPTGDTVSCMSHCVLHSALCAVCDSCALHVTLHLTGAVVPCRSYCVLYVTLCPVCHTCPTSARSAGNSFWGVLWRRLCQSRAQTHSCRLRRAESGCKATAQGWTVGVPHLQARRELGRTPIPQKCSTQWEPRELRPKLCSPGQLLVEGACEQGRFPWGQEGAVLCSELGLPPPVCSMEPLGEECTFCIGYVPLSAFEAKNADGGPGMGLKSITNFTQLIESLRSEKTFQITKPSH